MHLAPEKRFSLHDSLWFVRKQKDSMYLIVRDHITGTELFIVRDHMYRDGIVYSQEITCTGTELRLFVKYSRVILAAGWTFYPPH